MILAEPFDRIEGQEEQALPLAKRERGERAAGASEGLGSKAGSGEKQHMAGGKTTQTGMGDAKPSRSTRLGLKVERKKIITKRGMVAPSPEDPARLEEFVPESDRKARESEIVKRNAQLDASSSEAGGVYHKTTDPMGLTPPPVLDQMQLEAMDPPEETGDPEAELEAVESTRELETDPLGMDPPDPEDELRAERIAAHEDVTPREGTDIEDPDVRARFRTAPGGGVNRVSGGREHARAYVSPVTVKPGTPTTPVTGAVKVLDVVEKAVRAYQTEPSLLRRRLSSLPLTRLEPPADSQTNADKIFSDYFVRGEGGWISYALHWYRPSPLRRTRREPQRKATPALV